MTVSKFNKRSKYRRNFNRLRCCILNFGCFPGSVSTNNNRVENVGLYIREKVIIPTYTAYEDGTDSVF